MTNEPNYLTQNNQNRSGLGKYIVGGVLGLATLGTIAYGISKFNNSDANSMPAISIIDSDNSNINIIQLENSQLEINDSYLAVDKCCGTSTKPAVVPGKKSPVKKTTPTGPVVVIDSIDDCVNGKDLFLDPVLTNDVQKSVYENKH